MLARISSILFFSISLVGGAHNRCGEKVAESQFWKAESPLAIELREKCREAGVDVLRLNSPPAMDLSLTGFSRVEEEALLKQFFGSSNTFWSLHEVRHEPMTLATALEYEKLVTFVRVLLDRVEQWKTRGELNPVSMGQFGAASSQTLWKFPQTKEVAFAEEIFSLVYIPSHPPKQFRAVLVGLPEGFEIPIVLSNYRLGEADALVIVFDDQNNILGVAPFGKGYQDFILSAVRRRVEETLFEMGGERIRSLIASAQTELKNNDKTQQLANYTLWQKRNPFVPSWMYHSSIPEDRRVTVPSYMPDENSRMFFTTMAFMWPLALIPPIVLASYSAATPDAMKTIGQVGVAHILLFFSFQTYHRALYIATVRSLGLFSYFKPSYRKLLKERRAAKRKEQNLRDSILDLEDLYLLYRLRVADNLRQHIVDEKQFWFPSHPLLVEYYNRKGPEMMAPEDTRVRVLFRRIEALKLEEELVGAILQTLEKAESEYFKGVAAAEVILDAIEERRLGSPLLFKNAF